MDTSPHCRGALIWLEPDEGKLSSPVLLTVRRLRKTDVAGWDELAKPLVGENISKTTPFSPWT